MSKAVSRRAAQVGPYASYGFAAFVAVAAASAYLYKKNEKKKSEAQLDEDKDFILVWNVTRFIAAFVAWILFL